MAPGMGGTAYGATGAARVSEGKIVPTGGPQGRRAGGMMITAGKRWRTVVAKRTTSVIPTTNSGSAARTRVVSDVTTSNGRSRHSAVYAPIAIDSGIEMRPAQSSRNAELTMRPLK